MMLALRLFRGVRPYIGAALDDGVPQTPRVTPQARGYRPAAALPPDPPPPGTPTSRASAECGDNPAGVSARPSLMAPPAGATRIETGHDIGLSAAAEFFPQHQRGQRTW